MADEKIVKPDVVIQLTNEQIQQIAPLISQQTELESGMIFGSVSPDSDWETAGFSYIPQAVAVKIIDLAYQELGDKDDNG